MGDLYKQDAQQYFKGLRTS